MNATLRSSTLFLVLIAAGIFCGCKPPDAPSAAQAEPAIEVNTVHPHRGEVCRFITLPGEVHPLYQVTLFAKVAGYLENLTVDKGDSVKAGDLIADIEVPELRADKTKYEAELELAEANFKQAEEVQAKATPETEKDAKSNLAVAKGKLSVAKANLEYTDTMLKYARITAPFDGVVTKRYVDPGAFIPAPNAADTPESAAIIILTDFTTLRMQIAVPEMEVPRIALGQPVEFTADALPGKHYDGTVTRFYYALDRHTKTMLTEVQMPNQKLELRPGMLVTGRIAVEKKEDALLVPVAALVVEKSNSFVYKAADGKASKVRVKTGFNDGINVEIASGVGVEDVVIAAGPRAMLHDGQPVKIRVSQ